MKWSIIIPTMFKSKRLIPMLEQMQTCDVIDEVILINNTTQEPDFAYLSKVWCINELRNTGVNPAWNKGVLLAKNRLIALVNDDITFNVHIFGALREDTIRKFGFIGQGSLNFNQEQKGAPTIINKVPDAQNTGGWGTLIVFHKDDWIPIPEELVIWYGDNFVKDIHPAGSGTLVNFRIDTEMSTTSDLPEFDARKAKDTEYWNKNYITLMKQYSEWKR